jgi:DNA-binding CsgD family transcriptional regulator
MAPLEKNQLAPEQTELSDREREILRLVATGASNKQIAQQLKISPNTVKVHLRNIFSKIGAASRTEATLYAIRRGLVEMPGTPNTPLSTSPEFESPLVTTPFPGEAVEQEPLPSKQTKSRFRQPAWFYAGSAGIILLILVALRFGPALLSHPPAATPIQLVTPSPIPTLTRWEEKAPLLTARSGLAVAVYENQIYAIGGESLNGVTGVVEKYDPTSNSWTTLTPKPAPVADINAAVIGGRVYVPGGRLASGQPTNLLEIYDPRLDQWKQGAALPIPLSGYAMSAFEGKIYLFGGWDGKQYLASMYEYNPDTDAWTARTPMPTARRYASAAVANGKIYVIGGEAGADALAVNEAYVPEKDRVGQIPWESHTSMPEGRFKMGITSVADIIHVVGGEGEKELLLPLEYFPQQDEWRYFEASSSQPWSGLGLAVAGTNLYAVGGEGNHIPIARHEAYQAIYTIAIPVMK